MRWNPFNNKVGIALGGGGARGIAHIGVLKALEEEHIEICYISGTSIGALVASYYAFGKGLDEIRQSAETMNFNTLVGWSIEKLEMGVFTLDAIEKRILDDLGDVNIEDANIPLAICTTDIISGKSIVHTRGSLSKIVCASMAIPGLISPVDYDGKLLVDGGITQNVPVQALDQLGAGITIAVDLNGSKAYPKPKNAISVMANAIDIAIDGRTRQQLQMADVVISMDLSDFSRFNNKDRFVELSGQGYKAARMSIDKLISFERFSYLHYLRKVTRASWPLKIPIFLKSIYRYYQR